VFWIRDHSLLPFQKLLLLIFGDLIIDVVLHILLPIIGLAAMPHQLLLEIHRFQSLNVVFLHSSSLLDSDLSRGAPILLLYSEKILVDSFEIVKILVRKSFDFSRHLYYFVVKMLSKIIFDIKLFGNFS